MFKKLAFLYIIGVELKAPWKPFGPSLHFNIEWCRWGPIGLLYDTPVCITCHGFLHVTTNGNLITQSAECDQFHQCCRLVADFTICEVGMRWSAVRKGIGDVGWSTKKILERIGRKFQKCGTLDVNSKNICTWNKLPHCQLIKWPTKWPTK